MKNARYLMTLFLGEKLLTKPVHLLVLIGQIAVNARQLVLLQLEIVHHVDHFAHLLVVRGSHRLQLARQFVPFHLWFPRKFSRKFTKSFAFSRNFLRK